MEEEKKDETQATPAEAGAQPSTTSEERCAEMEAAWKRALADYANLQKEVARERVEMGQYATLRVIERFLPVFDNFHVAVSHMPKTEDKTVLNWALGVGFIQKQIDDAMKDLGLTAIETEGKMFDAAKHEAVGEEEVAAGLALPPGSIVREVQKGYEINGKVVRPAKVIISK